MTTFFERENIARLTECQSEINKGTKMPRISKKPDERKNELIETALTLFLEKGYENTAVSDIVKQIGIAQGTFYYHFKSKAEILEAMINKYLTYVEKEMLTLFNSHNDNMIHCLNKTINTFYEMVNRNQELLDYIHHESNAVLHDKLVKLTMEKLIPVLTKMVEKGVIIKQFSVHYPIETVEIILSAIFWQFHQPGIQKDKKRLKRIKISLEHLLDRVLGVEDHTFTLDFGKKI